MDTLGAVDHPDQERALADTRRILFIDDEAHVLEGIKRLFRPMRAHWHADYETDPRRALARIESEPYDVIVSDMKMPGLSGVDVLRHAQKHAPNAVRIGLSGYAEAELALEAAAVAHQFFAKPCEIRDLLEAASQVTALAERLRGNEMLVRVTAGSSLPSLPDLYQEIMREASSPTGSLQRVGEIIQRDVAMSAKILSIVNSPFFGLSNQSTSPAQAAALIGFEGLRSIVLTAGVFEAYEDKIDVDVLSALMNRSIDASRIAGEVAALLGMGKQRIERCRLAAMLHDIGKLTLYANASHAARMVEAMVRSGVYDEPQAEQELFGCSHADVGAYLLSLWGFANEIVQAAAFHHDPSRAAPHSEPQPLTVVHIASALTACCGRGRSTPIDRGYLASFGISTEDRRWQQIMACAQPPGTESEDTPSAQTENH